MEKTEKHIGLKRVLFLIILLVMTLPLIQQLTQFANIKDLNGHFEPAEKPQWSVSNWFDGTFQEATKSYLNENFGFRNEFVRIRNQVDFSLYAKTHTAYVSKGIDDYMFVSLYINAVYGTDYMGIDSIVMQMEKLKAVQDTLEKLGTQFVFVFAPGKGSFYSEFIPKQPISKMDSTNYDVMVQQAKKNGINYLDFSAWFQAAKDTSTFPLFPKTGIHWSEYGALLAADSIVRYLEFMDKVNFPDPTWNGVRATDSLHKNDRDLERAMNLFLKISNQKMGYHNIKYPKADDRNMDYRTLVIADSYYYQLHPHHYKLWACAEFWYYNKQAKNVVPDKTLKVDELDLKTELEKQDFIIILSTDAQLNRLGWGWIDDAYNLYYP